MDYIKIKLQKDNKTLLTKVVKFKYNQQLSDQANLSEMKTSSKYFFCYIFLRGNSWSSLLNCTGKGSESGLDLTVV